MRGIGEGGEGMVEVFSVVMPEAPTLDVVFLHGLGGDARTTWATGEAFWPDWLGQDVPGAAVWLVGYAASPVGWFGPRAMPLQDRAGNVLAALQNEGVGERPLVLVAHSMGGLVAKQMLRYADASPAYASFAAAARGVVFLATPHFGADMATFLKHLKLVLRTTAAIDDLQRNAAHLRDLNFWYRHWAHRTGIRNLVFFEAYSRWGVQVVDAGSADPGLAGVDPIAVDADHLTICKPGRRSELVYGQVRRFLAAIHDIVTVTGPAAGQVARETRTRIPGYSDEVPARTADEVATRGLPSTGCEPAWPVNVGVVPQLADRYQEREVSPLLQRTPAGSRTVTLVLAGMGGVGKTQIAAQYTERERARKALDLLVWATATARSEVVTGYAEAAVRAGIPGADERNPEEAARRFLEWLAATDRQWLIVLDDLEDPACMRGLWPPNSRAGQVLVTTRRRDPSLVREDRVLIEVGVFTPGDSEAYVNAKLVGRQHLADGAAGLAADLGHLPLALAQAVAYMLNRGLTAEQYRQRLAESRRGLREVLPEPGELPDDHQRTVDVTWSLSVELADTLNPPGMARPLLELASLLDANGVPDAVFTARPVLDHLAASLGRSVTPADVRDALHVLHRLSLATVDLSGPDRAVQVHALVQRATRDTLADVGRLGRTAADALLISWPANHTDANLAQALRSNVRALDLNTPDSLWLPGAHPVLVRHGRSLAEAGLAVDAAVFFTRLRLACADRLGEDHTNSFVLRHHLAHSRAEIMDYAGAAAEYERVLADERRVLGDEHPLTLTARSCLAHWRGQDGDSADVITELEQVLADQRRVLGDDHPDILTTRHRLAYWRGRAGHEIDAVKELYMVLADERRVFGDDHPQTLSTRRELADWRGNAGDTMGAVWELMVLIEDQRRVLGDDHLDTLSTRGMAAVLRIDSGDPAGAMIELEALLADQRRVLGDDHVDTLTTLDIMMNCRDAVSDPSDAVDEVAELLANLRCGLGDDHPATMATRFSLANHRGMAGDVAGAVSVLEELLAVQQRVLGDDHPATLGTRHNLDHWRQRS
ncbi:Tetratricopeptide repeat-containing protein [Amycolatopsis tolypomycina]|uniref:Tetratricopeptide repeat-containing protein n=1 Tax=Amycolatopsis tolypomycina TaxID=208445 RepID=A0A1H4XGR2_9PSEU|nr:FxSxx-COOH system tetratricopeptide repeat protein [Amycolatopsis tolypomycina]SED04793.1 Tetratricopeptide repeat-containing protein [Amycolatopsis tolypomycina]